MVYGRVMVLPYIHIGEDRLYLSFEDLSRALHKKKIYLKKNKPIIPQSTKCPDLIVIEMFLSDLFLFTV